MREIKFRAYHPDTMKILPVETIDWDETGYLTEVSAGYCWAERFSPEKFNKLVLMQYTGLKDRNGKEIYEGDVVINRSPSGVGVPCEVIYSYGDCGFVLRSISKGANYGSPHNFQFIEVNGNIYQNPNPLSNSKEQ